MPRKRELDPRLAPAPKLAAAVEAFFDSAARELFPSRPAQLDTLFAIGFLDRLARWKTGGKDHSIGYQIRTTRQIIAIFEGDVPAAYLTRDSEKKFQELHKVVGRYSKRNGVLAALQAFLSKLENREGEFGDAPLHASRWLETFPDHIPEIVALINRAREKIIIQADCLDFGSFRNFGYHETLVEAICEASRSKRIEKIEFLIWTDNQPMSWANRFRLGEKRREGEFLTCLSAFLAALKPHRSNFPAEYDAVTGRINHRANWASSIGDILYLRDLQKSFLEFTNLKLRDAGVCPIFSGEIAAQPTEVVGTAEERPWFKELFWIVDDIEGVIVHPVLGEDALAEITTDEMLIQSLSKTFDRQYADAKRHISKRGSGK
jgi:hypothetical protein